MKWALIFAMTFRIYAELPIDANVSDVLAPLRQAATAAGCAEPLTEMFWRGNTEHSLEVLVSCPAGLKEALREKETPRSHQP